MRPRAADRRIRLAALFTLAILTASSSLRAQNVTVNIPGAAFTSVGSRVAVEDVGGGRRFRGEAFALVTLQAKLQMPSTSVAEQRLQRLVIRFRTSVSGPSLRAVELRSGSNRAWRLETNIEGDFSTCETAGTARVGQHMGLRCRSDARWGGLGAAAGGAVPGSLRQPGQSGRLRDPLRPDAATA
jgi:hypothetical protein